jgi:ESF2/ABP1 family protein
MYLEDRALPSLRGVVYLSSVPREMSTSEVKKCFLAYGDIFRSRFVPYETAEAASAREEEKKRAKKLALGKSSGPPTSYREAWLEFVKAEDAEFAAKSLNGTAVDVKRTRKAYGELWNVKYLPGFTWEDLVNEAESKRRELKQRRFLMLKQERRNNELFRKLVREKKEQREQAKMERFNKKQQQWTSQEMPQGDEEVDEASDASKRKPQKKSTVEKSQKRKERRLSPSSSDVAGVKKKVKKVTPVATTEGQAKKKRKRVREEE